MAKCICKNQDCKIEIRIDGQGFLNFTDKKGDVTIMYLDANAIANLIAELETSLNGLIVLDNPFIPA